MSAGTVRVGPVRMPDRTLYLCSDAGYADMLLKRAELAGLSFSVLNWVDNAATGTLRIEQGSFSLYAEMPAADMLALAAALKLCAEDLQSHANQRLPEAA
jgi:hypothetical protein